MPIRQNWGLSVTLESSADDNKVSRIGITHVNKLLACHIYFTPYLEEELRAATLMNR